MSTPTYDPFGTETTYKSKLFLCKLNGSFKQNKMDITSSAFKARGPLNFFQVGVCGRISEV